MHANIRQMLENNIIKLNHKSFHQIVVLGSSSFVPFMQLSGGARREVIEDLLDINVFSKMNGILKEQTSILKDKINNNAHEINLVDTKILAQKKYLRDLTTITSAQKKEKQETINNLQEDIRVLNESNGTLTSEITTNQPTLNEESTKVSGTLLNLISL